MTMKHFYGKPDSGCWQVLTQNVICGEGINEMPFVATSYRVPIYPPGWWFSGVSSHLRYTTGEERVRLNRRPGVLGRPSATYAALIPIRKNEAWWALAQDERRAIYAQSQHLEIGLDYLPEIARQLFHCRDAGEPFDFLTWFEFPPKAADRFDELVARLRATEEWQYVDREIDIRLMRTDEEEEEAEE